MPTMGSSSLIVPSCQVRRTTDLSYTSGKIAWESTTSGITTDTSMWSSGAPTKITLPTSGLWLISLYTLWTATATVTLFSNELHVSGNPIGANYGPIYAGSVSYSTFTTVTNAAAGSYVEAAATIIGGSAYVLNGASSGFEMSSLTATYLGRSG